MSDTNVAIDTETTEAETSEAEAIPFGLQDVSQLFFGPEQQEAAGEYIGKVMSVTKARLNWKQVEGQPHPIPEGFGIGVLPLYRRADKAAGEEPGNKVDQVLICQMPAPDLVFSHQLGEAFLREIVLNAEFARLKKFAAAIEDESDWNDIPSTIEQFLTAPSRGEGMKSWSKLGPRLVKDLKSRGLKDLTLDTLKSCLQSAVAAERIYPDYDQAIWVKMLHMLISLAPRYEENKQPMPLPTQWFTHCLETRDQAEAHIVEANIFDDMFAKFGVEDDGQVEDATEEAAE